MLESSGSEVGTCRLSILSISECHESHTGGVDPNANANTNANAKANGLVICYCARQFQ